MSRSEDSQPIQDFSAALHEVQSNLDVRRLMLVITNVLVPALAMAMTDCMSGSHYSPELAWLPRHIVAIVGLTLAIAGTLVTGILARCHFGLVVNGSKIRHVRTGRFVAYPLNWLGVTTNFTALTALSAGAGFSLFLASIGLSLIAAIAGPALLVALMLYLRVNHWRANRLCRRLESNWQQGAIPVALQEQHARLSLEATASDIAVVVAMAVALFAGMFNGMTNIGGIPPDLELSLPVSVIREWGVVALSGYTLVSLLLSGRMVVRLRLALAEHSRTLARLRSEADDPYRFKAGERTFILFLLLELITSVSAVILFWALVGLTAGLAAGAGVVLLGLVAYPTRLARARRRLARTEKKASEPEPETVASSAAGG
ncbi:MAG: hypothetical protein O7J95_17830 [Planctomycetota bacterium]|nr:hypothetical protein [Planctomycetota bacterium]